MITATRAHLHTAAATHAGMKGKNNEDRYAVSAHQVSQSDHTPSLLAIVCDGIGGHRAGEVAAELAVETISRVVAESDAQQPKDILHLAITQASQAIHEQSESDPTQQGMGATCVIAWVIGDRLYTASVGDSRLYLLRAGMIRQLTTDHTWVQEALEAGALTPEQAVGHPNMHVIRRYLGSKTPPEPDFRLHMRIEESSYQAENNQGMRLLSGDQLILTSDGLTDLVKKEEIREAFQQYDRQKALLRLIDLANARGGHDNITIVILEVPLSGVGAKIDQTLIVPTHRKAEPTLSVPAPLKAEPTLSIPASTKPIKRYRIPLVCGGIAILFLLVAATVVALGYFSGAIFNRTPLPTRFIQPSSTPKPSATRSPVPPTPTATATETTTSTPTDTATTTVTSTLTPTLPSITTDTSTPTSPFTPTRTRVTITPGGQHTDTPTLTSEATSTPTPTMTSELPASDTPTSTPTLTNEPQASDTPTFTLPPTSTPTHTLVPPTPTPTNPPPTDTPTIGFTPETPVP